MSEVDSTGRFSQRVADYVAARPGYPERVLEILAAETGLGESWAVADLGSGTGISAELFLRRGCRVWGIEPNAAMRQAAEVRFAAEPRFVSLNASAESTTLADASMDLAVAAQAFHWFDRERTRTEVRRIVRPGGWVALLFNRRLTEEPGFLRAGFLRAYEDLLLRYGTDYREVDHRHVTAASLADFFGSSSFSRYEIPNAQSLDLAGLRSRLLSSSYTPPEDHPDRVPMLAALDEIFAQHRVSGRVEMLYATELSFAPAHPR